MSPVVTVVCLALPTAAYLAVATSVHRRGVPPSLIRSRPVAVVWLTRHGGRRWFAIALAVIAAVSLWPALGGLAPVLAAAALGVRSLLISARRRGAGGRYDAALLDVLDGLARHLRSGATLPVALRSLAEEHSGPVGDDLQAVVAAIDLGALVPNALIGWRDARPRPSVRMVCAALALGHRTGTLAARVADDLAATMRQLHDTRQEGAALATQAQASAAVMTLAPLALGALLVAADPAARSFLTGTVAGAACIALGLTADLLAATAMVRAIIGADEEPAC